LLIIKIFFIEISTINYNLFPLEITQVTLPTSLEAFTTPFLIAPIINKEILPTAAKRLFRFSFLLFLQFSQG
jgi:hypothetical protein